MQLPIKKYIICLGIIIFVLINKCQAMPIKDAWEIYNNIKIGDIKSEKELIDIVNKQNDPIAISAGKYRILQIYIVKIVNLKKQKNKSYFESLHNAFKIINNGLKIISDINNEDAEYLRWCYNIAKCHLIWIKGDIKNAENVTLKIAEDFYKKPPEILKKDKEKILPAIFINPIENFYKDNGILDRYPKIMEKLPFNLLSEKYKGPLLRNNYLTLSRYYVKEKNDTDKALYYAEKAKEADPHWFWADEYIYGIKYGKRPSREEAKKMYERAKLKMKIRDMFYKYIPYVSGIIILIIIAIILLKFRKLKKQKSEV